MNITIFDVDSAVIKNELVSIHSLMPPDKSINSQIIIDRGVEAKVKLMDEVQTSMILTGVFALLTKYSNPDFLVGCLQYTLGRKIIPYYLRPIEYGSCRNNEVVVGIKQYEIEGNSHPLLAVFIHADTKEQYLGWREILPDKDDMADFLVKKSYKLGYRSISLNYSNSYLHTPVIKLLNSDDIITILRESFGMKTIEREMAMITAKQSGIPVIRFSPVIHKPLLTTPNGNNYDLLKLLLKSNNSTNHAVIKKVNQLVLRFSLKTIL